MKNVAIKLTALFFTTAAYCQDAEFKVYSNGLIYSEQAMGKLTRIVDSLNLKYRTCNYNQVFYSRPQAVGHIISLDSGNIKAARTDIKNQISLDQFLKKYPKATIERDVLILKYKTTNDKNQDVVEFASFDLSGGYGSSIVSEDIPVYDKDLSNKWVFEYTAKSKYTDESLVAFYFTQQFRSQPIPKRYSQMIGYADCLIDTTTKKFKDDLEEGWVDLPANWTSLPQADKAKLLDKMRSTRIVGFCSQDSRPRDQAVNIALLSAETYNWQVFLKAHLDIMNDRFERMSDGSYAWAARNTYIKELEELNLNVADLVLGISFRVENPASNHYYGSISRIGRALSETKNPAEIEKALLSIISDNDLDYYNRLLVYFLFLNYNHRVTDETLKKENAGKLALAARTLPAFFSEKLAR
jgi:hypothetical protein